MRLVLMGAEKVWNKHGEELVVTLGLDGEHSAGSAHHYGCVTDIPKNE